MTVPRFGAGAPCAASQCQRVRSWRPLGPVHWRRTSGEEVTLNKTWRLCGGGGCVCGGCGGCGCFLKDR